jgi:glyoxylase-like metal-dependent hydrolase (beta-lactamase superfamily II)
VADILFLERLPFIDVDGGGNFDSLIQVIGHLLSGLPEDTLIIPGHGPLCDKKEFARHHAFLFAVQQHVRKNPKMSPKELADSFDKGPWKDKEEPNPQLVNWESLFRAASGKGTGRANS